MSIDEGQVRELARSQRWLVTRGQLGALGWSDDRTGHQLRSGRWRRVQPGVYLLHPGDPTWEQLALGACLSAPAGTVVSHRAAFRLHGLGLPTAPVEVTVSYGHRSLAGGVLVHRSRRLASDDVTTMGGVPVTSVRRTLVDVGRYTDRRTVWKGVERGIRAGRTSAGSLRAYAEASRARPGARLLLAVLDARPAGRPAGSGAEVVLLEVSRATGLPAPVRQHPFDLADGSLAVVDMLWPQSRLVVEVDGPDSHDATTRDADLARDRQLLALGYRVARFPADEVEQHPVSVAREIARLLTAAA